MYQVEDMKPIDLATNAFGQNYNCTMVQMVSGFASLINGGTYYQPHLVTKSRIRQEIRFPRWNRKL